MMEFELCVDLSIWIGSGDIQQKP